MDKEKFGNSIAALRKKRGMTQEELARKIHVTSSAISKWERGIGLPDISNIEPLADALNVSVADIMKSDFSSENAVNADVSVAVENTLALAKIQKKKLYSKFIALFMLYVGIKAAWSVILDSNPGHYNNLPMPFVYILLTAYLICVGIVLFKAFKKGS